MGIWDIKKIILFLIICSVFQFKNLYFMSQRPGTSFSRDPFLRPGTAGQNPANDLLLHGVRSNNNTEIWLALHNKADVNIQDEFGQTPIHILILSINSINRIKSIQNIQLILNRNADLSIIDCNNSNVFHYAAKQDELEITKILMAKLNSKNPNKLYSVLNCRDLEKGRTPLHYAVINGNVILTAMLLIHNAYLKVKDAYEFTPEYYIHNIKNEALRRQFEKLIDSFSGVEQPFYLPAINRQIDNQKLATLKTRNKTFKR